MATYTQIQAYVKERHGFTPSRCSIADVLSGRGLTTRIAYNRIDKEQRVYPCPTAKRPAIEAALDHFGMR